MIWVEEACWRFSATNPLRFDTPVLRYLLGSKPNLQLQVARLSIHTTRWGTFSICLPAPHRRIYSSALTRVLTRTEKQIALPMDHEFTRNHSTGMLPQSRIVAIVVAFCLFVPLAGAVGEAIGGWLGFAIWLVFWLVMAVAASILTLRFSNPILPTLCGIMVGITAPRPSDPWLANLVGEALARGLSIAITIAAVGIALAIFNAISKQNRDSSRK